MSSGLAALASAEVQQDSPRPWLQHAALATWPLHLVAFVGLLQLVAAAADATRPALVDES